MTAFRVCAEASGVMVGAKLPVGSTWPKAERQRFDAERTRGRVQVYRNLSTIRQCQRSDFGTTIQD